MISIIKTILNKMGVTPVNFLEASIKKAANEQGLVIMSNKLVQILPDISNQYSQHTISDSYNKTKVRMQQASQMRLFEKAVRMQNKKKMVVVDIGDSAGTHLTYIKDLCKDISFRTISVNLDEKAVKKVRDKGMEALHCAAEDLNLESVQKVDLFVSFQMVEHLMNPCSFFRKLAQKGTSDYLLVTVPYRKTSSLGLWTYRGLVSDLTKNKVIRDNYKDLLNLKKFAENEHIFELSPIHWKTLMLFSGWISIYDEIYFQYPKKNLLYLTKPYWKKFDFEGFGGVILKRDLSFSNIYKSWPEF